MAIQVIYLAKHCHRGRVNGKSPSPTLGNTNAYKHALIESLFNFISGHVIVECGIENTFTGVPMSELICTRKGAYSIEEISRTGGMVRHRTLLLFLKK